MAGKNDDKIRCSFCGKTQDQTRKLIAGPKGAYICDDCISICVEIMDEELYSRDFDDVQEEEIDLLKLAKVLWRKIWVILICAVVLGIAGYYWTYRKMYTSYKSSALLYVNNNSVSLGSAKLSISSGDIRAVNNLMETYSIILNSRNTLTEIIEETGIPFTYEELKSMIKSETVNDTAIFKITVTTPDPELSAHLANSILEVLPGKISTVIEGASAQIVDYAVKDCRDRRSDRYRSFLWCHHLLKPDRYEDQKRGISPRNLQGHSGTDKYPEPQRKREGRLLWLQKAARQRTGQASCKQRLPRTIKAERRKCSDETGT